MSNLSIEGKIKRVHDEQVISDRFKKREFVIETEEQYPQVLIFQLTQDKTNLIDAFQIGDKVEVFFNLRGREWQRDPQSEIRVFNTLDAWRVQKTEVAPSAQEMPATDLPSSSEMDDLPF